MTASLGCSQHYCSPVEAPHINVEGLRGRMPYARQVHFANPKIEYVRGRAGGGG